MRTVIVTILLAFVVLAGAQAKVFDVNAPRNNSEVGDRFTLRGNGPAGGEVEVTGSAHGSTRIGPHGYWELTLSVARVPAGEPIRLRVIARDRFGNRSGPIVMHYYAAAGGGNRDNRNITQLSVNLPANGSGVGNNFVLSGTGTPGATVEINGTLNRSGTVNDSGHWRIRINTTSLPHGAIMRLRVRAYDRFGNYSRVVPVEYYKR
jgi:hypothetical protein